jgi:hypothetical protein
MDSNGIELEDVPFLSYFVFASDNSSYETHDSRLNLVTEKANPSR